MGRQEKIARSIVRAIANGSRTKQRPGNALGLILAFLSVLFSLYQLALEKVRPADFANLRRRHWAVSDDEYIESFKPGEGERGEGERGEVGLDAIGDMGFSGSVSSTVHT